MNLQVQDIVKDTLGLINVLEADETPSASDIQLGIRTANIMLDSWSANNLMLRASVQESFPLVIAQNQYTIGIGADFNTDKPLKIRTAFIRDSASTDFPVTIVPKDHFNAFSTKSTSIGRPEYLYYNPGLAQQTVHTGTIQVYYSPDQAYTLFMDVEKYLTEFNNPTDNVTFEPMYYEALIYNLAPRLWRHYRKPDTQVPMDILVIGKEAMAGIMNRNSVKVTSTLDLPGKQSSFNIYSGEETN